MIQHDALRQEPGDVAEGAVRPHQYVGRHHIVERFERVLADMEVAAGIGKGAEIGHSPFRIEIERQWPPEWRKRLLYPIDLTQHKFVRRVTIDILHSGDVAPPEMNGDREAAGRAAMRGDRRLRAAPIFCSQSLRSPSRIGTPISAGSPNTR